MNFGLAFSYIFNDKEWFKKLALPALCGLIPFIGPFILAGWGLKVVKNVIDGNEQNALPKLEFGADLGRGFIVFLINLIYSLPILILALMCGLIIFFDFQIDESLIWVLFVAGFCVVLISALLWLILRFMRAAGLANYVAKGEFRAAFNFKQIFGLLKKSFISWLLVIVAQVLAMFIIAPLGVIACLVGAALTSAFAIAIYRHLLGQAYNKATEPAVETL